jgi:hypothetical protein
VNDVLLIVDVLNDFEHEDGYKLLASFRQRQPALVAALARAQVTAGAPDTHARHLGRNR